MSTLVCHHCLKPVMKLLPYPKLFLPTVFWSVNVKLTPSFRVLLNSLLKFPDTIFFNKLELGKTPLSLVFVKLKLYVVLSSPPLKLTLFKYPVDFSKKLEGSFLAATQGVGFP